MDAPPDQQPRAVACAVVAGRLSMCGLCRRSRGRRLPPVTSVENPTAAAAMSLAAEVDEPEAFVAVDDYSDSDATPAHNSSNNVKCFPQLPPPIIQKSEVTHGSPLLGTPRGAAGDAGAVDPSPPLLLSTPEKPTRRLQLIKPIRRWRRANDSNADTAAAAGKRSSMNSPLARGSGADNGAGAGSALNSLVTQVAKAEEALLLSSDNNMRRAAVLPPPASTLALTDLNTGPYLPPPLPEHEGRPVLVLDLDETLVHSSFVEVPKYDFLIPVEIEGVTHAIYVAKRPGVDHFLLQVAKWYEVVIFTASLEKYASPLMDKLDPAKCCTHRLFRERCILWNGQYVKDLGRLGRKVERVVILDNSPSSYAFQPQNAIPIGSWFDDLSDNELPTLLPLLNELSRMSSIPTAIANATATTTTAT